MFRVNDIVYEIDSIHFIANVKMLPNNDDILLPRSFIYESNEYIIKSILQNCLGDFPSTKHIRFSEDSEVEIIEDSAFSCSKLVSITLPPKLTTLQANTFLHSTRLETIKFTADSKLKCVKNQSLSSLKRLETINLPSNVEFLEEGFCCFTPMLKNISFLSENSNFFILENKILLGKLTLESLTFDHILFAPRNLGKKVTIPSFIRKIGDHAFSTCQNLESIEFEENNEGLIIGKWSFAFTNIRKIFFPSFIKSLGECTFYRCQNLNEIVFSDYSNIKYLPSETFFKTNLKNIIIPKGIEKVDLLTFKYCDYICSIEFLGENVEIIITISFIHNHLIAIMSFPNAKTLHFPSYYSDINNDIFYTQANCSFIFT